MPLSMRRVIPLRPCRGAGGCGPLRLSLSWGWVRCLRMWGSAIEPISRFTRELRAFLTRGLLRLRDARRRLLCRCARDGLPARLRGVLHRRSRLGWRRLRHPRLRPARGDCLPFTTAYGRGGRRCGRAASRGCALRGGGATASDRRRLL